MPVKKFNNFNFKGFDFTLDQQGLKLKPIEIRGAREEFGVMNFDVKVGKKWHKAICSLPSGVLENAGRTPQIEFGKKGYTCRVWTFENEDYAIAAIKNEMSKFLREHIAEIRLYSAALHVPVIKIDSLPVAPEVEQPIFQQA
jgi:hypothetical protein